MMQHYQSQVQTSAAAAIVTAKWVHTLHDGCGKLMLLTGRCTPLTCWLEVEGSELAGEPALMVVACVAVLPPGAVTSTRGATPAELVPA